MDIDVKTNSLCWECARACGGANCPWADSLRPVRGWILAPDHGITKGVTVLYCPMFFKGRNLSVMSEEDIMSYSTNAHEDQVCRPQIAYNGHKRDRVYQCPKCGYTHKTSTLKCLGCGIGFLVDGSSNYATSYQKLLLRKQFIQENSYDFPNSRYKLDLEED